MRTIFCVKLSINNRVRCTTQLAKLSFNHSNRRTHSWRFSTFEKKYMNTTIRLHITGEPTLYIRRVLVYARPQNDLCRTPQQYHVGENYSSINKSMRAEESCRERPLYSRKRPCRRKVLCTCYVPKSVRCYENTIYKSPCTQKPWNTDERQTEGITCAHGSVVHELALSLVILVSYSMRTGHGSEVSPDYRRSSSGRNHMHARYIRCHKKMPHSSWRKFSW